MLLQCDVVTIAIDNDGHLTFAGSLITNLMVALAQRICLFHNTEDSIVSRELLLHINICSFASHPNRTNMNSIQCFDLAPKSKNSKRETNYARQEQHEEVL